MSIFIISHLFKTFKVNKNKIDVLKDINLVFPDTGFVSIVGKSGSGKSTLLNVLAGIEKASKGKVFYKGKNISKFNDEEFSDYHLTEISLVFQHFNLINDLTALENVILPLKMNGVSSNEAKKRANEYFKKLSVDSLINRKVNNLSGGEKQRVAIIRSLLINPNVILCDEPTGALDHKNSIEIMEILKTISASSLVIMVSHNVDLVEKYSDQIITLKDGQISSNITIRNNIGKSKIGETYDYKEKWKNKFVVLNFKKNFFKNLLSILACSICYASMLVSIGFSVGSKSSQSDALNKNLSLRFSTASKTEFIELEGSPLSYQKTSRPSMELIDENFPEFKSIKVRDNISYLISDFASCYYNNNQINNFQMIPLLDCLLESFGSDLLVCGTGIRNEFQEIIINEEFQTLIGETNALDKDIVLSSSAPITYSTGDSNRPFVKDSLNYTMKFRIVGVVKEFAFLNTPKIYYSYDYAANFLRQEKMENLSIYLNKPISYFSYLENCANDDPVCSYSFFLFLDDLDEQNAFFERITSFINDDNELQISSTALELRDTYMTFIDSFASVLFVFVIVAFLGINFILGMIGLSTFIENKKMTAILTILGSRNKTIYSLFLSENYIVVFVSFLISIFLSNAMQKILNLFIFKKFELENLISIPYSSYLNIPYGLLIITLVISIVFSTIFTLVPMKIYRNHSLSDELRDE